MTVMIQDKELHFPGRTKEKTRMAGRGSSMPVFPLLPSSVNPLFRLAHQARVGRAADQPKGDAQ